MLCGTVRMQGVVEECYDDTHTWTYLWNFEGLRLSRSVGMYSFLTRMVVIEHHFVGGFQQHLRLILLFPEAYVA